MKCPKCQHENPDLQKFCGECGQKLAKLPETEKAIPEIKGERKHVTVLFSDLSGYTNMSEQLDPEEVKEIMSKIFGEIAQIVDRYEGFIEKFIGDAIVAIFGATKAYEDNPIRAIRAAREIHNLVESLSPKYEEKIGHPLSMHTGINTGLVVIGKVDLEKGTHGISGDTINLAARLSGIGKAGDILVDSDTHSQAEGHFDFEDLGTTKLKGKTESVQVYKVIASRDQPRKVHRIHGLRSRVVGRKIEIAQLSEAIDKLLHGKGSIISICGEAGTGKSRLIEEFKATLDLDRIQWREGHAYPYAQNTPYFPLINLLSRAFQIKEGDSQEKVRFKVESGIETLLGKKADVIPYIGSLFSLRYPEIEGMSPDSWKYHLQKAAQEILSALTQRAPTVICLEDLHWSDPSSLELFRLLLTQTRHPVLFLCVYRPYINLFTGHQLGVFGDLYQEITLHDLSSSEMQEMLESLLKTKTIPPDLNKFIQQNIEGNPFYLEEVVNSLIESETLILENENWVFLKPISKSGVSPTIHGVISARLDRLEKETKRALQEASVIGRIFLYKILKRITEFEDNIDVCLNKLQGHDMIRVNSLQPDIEYIFKHTLTQEVVYNGLLIKEREKIHESIALIMERLFTERLPEFYETLAFHFEKGKSLQKAVNYLIKSGEKSLERYALEEANSYFNRAFNLLNEKQDKTIEERELLIDILIKWAFVYFWRGAFGELINLFKAYENLAKALNNKEKIGMFYAFLGMALQSRESLIEAHEYLSKALRVGEEIEHNKVIGYACSWLALTCADLGLLDEALVFAERGQENSSLVKSDRNLSLMSLRAIGYTSFIRGDCKRTKEIGEIFLNYGQTHSDIRSTSLGHTYLGMYHTLTGDFSSSIKYYQNGIHIMADPFLVASSKAMLGISYLWNGQVAEAEQTFGEVINFSKEHGSEYLGTITKGFSSITLLTRGQLNKGIRIAEDVLQELNVINSKYRIAAQHVYLGNVYLQMLKREGPKNIAFIVKNIIFLIKNLMYFGKKSEYHFNKAIEVAKEIGAKNKLGQSYFGMGLLLKEKGNFEQAKKYISWAIDVFEKSEADFYLKNAKNVFESLNK